MAIDYEKFRKASKEGKVKLAETPYTKRVGSVAKAVPEKPAAVEDKVSKTVTASAEKSTVKRLPAAENAPASATGFVIASSDSKASKGTTIDYEGFGRAVENGSVVLKNEGTELMPNAEPKFHAAVNVSATDKPTYSRTTADDEAKSKLYNTATGVPLGIPSVARQVEDLQDRYTKLASEATARKLYPGEVADYAEAQRDLKKTSDRLSGLYDRISGKNDLTNAVSGAVSRLGGKTEAVEFSDFGDYEARAKKLSDELKKLRTKHARGEATTGELADFGLRYSAFATAEKDYIDSGRADNDYEMRRVNNEIARLEQLIVTHEKIDDNITRQMSYAAGDTKKTDAYISKRVENDKLTEKYKGELAKLTYERHIAEDVMPEYLNLRKLARTSGVTKPKEADVYFEYARDPDGKYKNQANTLYENAKYIYLYGDEDLKRVIDYVYFTHGTKEAEKVATDLRELADAGYSEAVAKDYESRGKVGRFFTGLSSSIGGGIGDFASGVSGAITAFGDLFSDGTSYVRPNKEQIRANAVSSAEKNGIAKLGMDLTRNVVTQMPAIATSVATGVPLAGQGIFGIQVYGNGYADAVNSGAGKVSAHGYAAASTAMELGLQNVLGGIEAYGKTGGTKILEKLGKKGISLPSFDVLTASRPKLSAALTVFGKAVLDAGSEAVEEGLQEVFEPALRNLFLHENNELFTSEHIGDILYSALLGGLSSGVINSTGYPSGYREALASDVVSRVLSGKATATDIKKIIESERMSRLFEEATGISLDEYASVAEAQLTAFNNAAGKDFSASVGTGAADGSFDSLSGVIEKAAEKTTADDNANNIPVYKSSLDSSAEETAIDISDESVYNGVKGTPATDLAEMRENARKNSVSLTDGDEKSFAELLKNDERAVKAGLQTAKTLRTVGKALGVDVRLFSADGTADGFYLPAENAVYLNAGGKSFELSAVFKHETVHYLAENSAEEYEKFARIVTESYKKQYGEDGFDEYIKGKKSEYESFGKTLSDEEASEELVADMGMDLLRSDTFVRELAKSEKTLAERLLEVVRAVVNKVKKALGLDYTPTVTEALTELSKGSGGAVAVENGFVERSYILEPSSRTLPEILRYSDLVQAEKALIRAVYSAKNTTSVGENAKFFAKRYWHTDLSQDMLEALMSKIENDIRFSTNAVTDTANFLFTRIDGTDIFAIYSTENQDEPTLLYESKNERAMLELNALSYITEEFKAYVKKRIRAADGTKIPASVSVGDWIAGIRLHGDFPRAVQRGIGDGNVNLLQGSPKRRPSRAFESVVANLFKIQLGRIADGKRTGKGQKATPSPTVNGKVHTDLAKAELDELGKRIASGVTSQKKAVTDTVSRIFTKIDGKNVLAIYTTAGENAPSLLYEASGGDVKEQLRIIDLLTAEYNNGRKADRGGASDLQSAGVNQAFGGNRPRVENAVRDYVQYMERAGGNRDDNALSEQPRSGRHRAFGEVLRAVLEVQLTPGAGDNAKYSLSPTDTLERPTKRVEPTQKTEENGEKYIPKGEQPRRDVDVSAFDDNGIKVSRGIRTVAEAKVTPKKYVSQILRDISLGRYSHETVSDKSASDFAKEYLKNHSFEQAYHRIISADTILDKNDTALAMYLYNEAVNNAEFLDEADPDGTVRIDKLLVKMVRSSSEAGKTLQAQRMLKKLSPGGMLFSLSQTVEQYNAELAERLGKYVEDTDGEIAHSKRVLTKDDVSAVSEKGFTAFLGKRDKGRSFAKNQKPLAIDDSLQKKLLSSKTTAEANAVYDDIIEDLAGQIVAKTPEKLRAFRYLSMLSNPRTAVRNSVGNSLMGAVVDLRNFHVKAIEGALGVLGLINKQDRRNAFVGLSEENREKIADLRGYALELFDTYESVIRSKGKYSTTVGGEIEEKRRIFNSRFLEWARNAVSNRLEADDVRILKKRFAKTFAETAFARGYTLDDLSNGTASAETQRELFRISVIESQRATFREASALADTLNKIKRNGGALGFVVDSKMPFTKTPINVMKQGVVYSPMSLISGIGKLIRQTADYKSGRSEYIDTAEIVKRISEGLTGTELMLVGFWLASAGVLMGGGDGDERDDLKNAAGSQEYSLELSLGDRRYSVTVDWAAPVCMPLFMGAELEKLAENGGFDTADVLHSLGNLATPVLETSMMSGVLDSLETVRYSKGGDVVVDLLADTASNYALQFIPAVVSVVGRTIDEVSARTTATSSNGGRGMTERFARRLANKLPIIRSVVNAPYSDVFGKYEKNDGVTDKLMSAAENFLLPGYIGEVSGSASARHMLWLYEKTDRLDFVPSYVSSVRVGGETKKLGGREIYSFKACRGELYDEIIPSLIVTKWYTELSDEVKADVLAEFKRFADVYAKHRLFADYLPSSKEQRAIISDGAKSEDILEYLKRKSEKYAERTAL